MEKSRSLPFHKISNRSDTGIFFRHTSDWKVDGGLDFPHRDDYYIFAVLFDGKIEVGIDFKNVTVCGGEGIVIAPGQVHFPKFEGEYPFAWCLCISANYVSENCCRLLEQYSLNTMPVRFSDSSLADMACIFEMLRRHCDNIEFSKAMASAIVNLFLMAMTPVEKQSCDRYVSLMLQFKRLLNEHIATEKRPGAYASMLNISGVYLNETVKSVTGISVTDFIKSQIILKAKRLLMHTSMSLLEIGEELGYDDYSYFSRLFKKETGMTPTDFRKNLG